MEIHFRQLTEQLCDELQDGEVLLLNYAGEDSDFIRFNRNRLRQAGHVRQQSLQLDLIRDQRHASATLQINGDLRSDLYQAEISLETLRERLPQLPQDPFLHYATDWHDTHLSAKDCLPSARDAAEQIMERAQGLDLVGLWAGGEMTHGFANSLGQFNWHRNFNFNFDWSVYLREDKAVKQNYAGVDWNPAHLGDKIAYARETLGVLDNPPVTIQPGRYRVFLAPQALYELMSLLNWGGFGLKSHRTATTPLLKMVREGLKLDTRINISENHAAGVAPLFTRSGFIKPDTVTLIADGEYADCLAYPRSAKEYGTEVNCSIEHPQSLEMAGGELAQQDVLKELGTGVYISNLWYCNYSDRIHCRITGMTRFACLWVQNGVPVAPLNVMRFDESLFNILGNNLIGLTREREAIFDTNTYEHRSESTSRLPGALVDDFNFTL
mgnify:CR=1 FL=1